jgi:hypothetical protein
MKPKITYWPNGNKRHEEYIVDGKYYRTDGPAITGWHENGQKRYEAYYVDSKYHRTDGPARTGWYYDGQKDYEEYFIQGKQYIKEDFENSWEYNSYQFDLEIAESF